MQVVIEKLQAGAQKAQAVACKLETAQSSAQGEEALVSTYKLSYMKALPLLFCGCILCWLACTLGHLQSGDTNSMAHSRKSSVNNGIYIALHAFIACLLAS